MMRNDVANSREGYAALQIYRAESAADPNPGIKKETGYEPVPNFSLTNALIT